MFLEQVTAYIAVYFNCPSIVGYRYVLAFIDAATKYFWSYPLANRDELFVLSCFENLVRIQFANVCLEVRCLHIPVLCMGVPGTCIG